MSYLSGEPENPTLLLLNHRFLPLLALHCNVMKTLTSPYFMAATSCWNLNDFPCDFGTVC